MLNLSQPMVQLFTNSDIGHQNNLLRLQTSLQETTGVAPLHIACDQGHYDVVEELLTAGTSVNQLTFDSITSLYFATKANHREVRLPLRLIWLVSGRSFRLLFCFHKWTKTGKQGAVTDGELICGG